MPTAHFNLVWGGVERAGAPLRSDLTGSIRFEGGFEPKVAAGKRASRGSAMRA